MLTRGTQIDKMSVIQFQFGIISSSTSAHP